MARVNATQSESQAVNDVCVSLMNDNSVTVSPSRPIYLLTAQEIINEIIANSDNTDIRVLKLNGQLKRLFALWVTSPYLELQLQPLHRPYAILSKWDSLLAKHSTCSQLDVIENDDPILSFQRNVFADKNMEKRLLETDLGALRLLYYEAKLNVLDGRYPNDNYIKLAAIQAYIEMGPFDEKRNYVEYFRQNIHNYIPSHYKITQNNNNRINGLIRTLSGNHSNVCAQKIIAEYKKISKNETEYNLLRSYMYYLWNLPYYGSAFFSGQTEKTVTGLASLFNHFDLTVWVAINREGIHIINKENPELLLSVDYDHLLWEIGNPKDTKNPNCMSCLFIQVQEDSKESVNNVLQIFSRQTKLMDSIINSFVEDWNKQRVETTDETNLGDVTDGAQTDTTSFDSTLSRNSTNVKKLSFAKFDRLGHCINKTGSWLKK